MKTTLLLLVMLFTLSCQKEVIPTNEASEVYLKEFDKLSKDSVICSHDICVSEDELYREKGSPLYAIEDEAFYLKYKLAHELILKKVIEKQLASTGETFGSYYGKVKASIKVTDDEAMAYVKKLGLSGMNKEGPQWQELKSKIQFDRTNERLWKEFNQAQGNKDILVKIPRKERQTIELPYSKLLPISIVDNARLNVTIVYNPSRLEQRRLLKMVQAVSSYMKTINKKVSWYILPYAQSSSMDAIYQKLLICSVQTDGGGTYDATMEISQGFSSESALLEFLSSRKVKTDRLKTCLESPKTQKMISEINSFMGSSKLNKSVQIIYNSEIESHVPALIQLRERVEMKLKLPSVSRR